jgi:hypothetical protein
VGTDREHLQKREKIFIYLVLKNVIYHRQKYFQYSPSYGVLSPKAETVHEKKILWGSNKMICKRKSVT